MHYSKHPPGDIIEVQPGNYTDSSLVLKDKVNWFFHAGAYVKSNKTIFIIKNKIKCQILGLGNFKAKKHVLYQKNCKSKLIFEGLYFNSHKETFYLTNGKFIINGTQFKGNPILCLNNKVNVIMNFDIIESNSEVFVIQAQTKGKLIVSGNTIQRNVSNDSNGIEVFSNSFDFDLNVQEYVSNSKGTGYAVYLNIPTQGIKPTTLKFNFQQLNIVGGLLNSSGFISPNPDSGPQIIFNSERIDLTYAGNNKITTSPVLLLNSIKVLAFNVFLSNISRTLAVFDIQNAISFVRGQVISANGLDSLTYPHYLINLSNNGLVIFDCNLVSMNEMAFINASNNVQILFRSSNVNIQQISKPVPVIKLSLCEIVLNIDTININHSPTGINTIEYDPAAQANLSISFVDFNIDLGGSSNTGNIFNVYGQLTLNGKILNTNNAKYIIRSYTLASINSSSNVNIILKTLSENSCGGFLLEDSANIDIDNIYLNNSTNYLLTTTNNKTGTINFDFDNINLDILGFNLLGGNIILNGKNIRQNSINFIMNLGGNTTLNSNIEVIDCMTGVLSSTSSGQIDFDSDIININNDGTNLFNLLGSGNSSFCVENINNNNNYSTIFNIQNSSTNTNEVSINVPKMNINSLTTALILCGDYTNLKSNGNDWNVNNSSAIPTAISLSGNSSNLYANINYIHIPGRIIYADIGGNVVFRNKKSISFNSPNIEMFEFINGCIVDLEGNTLISDSFANMIEFKASTSGRSSFKYMSGLYRCVYIKSFGSIWHTCDNMTTTSNSAPVIGLEVVNTSNNPIHTVGGYMKTNWTNVIEIVDDGNHYQFPGLRLLGSMLVNPYVLGTNYSIYNGIPSSLAVSAQPSVSTNTLSANITINSNGLTPDPNVF